MARRASGAGGSEFLVAGSYRSDEADRRIAG